MDKLKKGRRPVRARMTKLINEAEALLQVDPPNKNQLRIKLDLLEKARHLLQDWDEKVKEQLLDDGTAEDEVDKEYDEIDDYEEKFLTIKRKIQPICDEILRPPSPAASVSTNYSTVAGGPERRIKLPEIKLGSFSGEIKDWLRFWSQFQKIHDDAEMSGSDKFHYLQQYMVPGTTAHQIVSSYPESSDNYYLVVEALKAEYGNEDMLLQVYVRELLRLVINNVNAREKIPLESLVLQLDSHLRSLKTLKLEDADPATWLFPLVESSLPEDILLSWQRSSTSERHGSNEDPPKSRLDILMEFLKKEVSIKKKIKLAQSGFQDDTAKKAEKRTEKKKEEKVPTLAGFHISDTSSCVFCDKGGHVSQECFTGMRMTMDSKKKQLSDKRACFVCLKIGHHSSKCKAKVMCALCGRKHHAIMCNPNSGKEKSQQQPSGMRPESVPVSQNADWPQAKAVSFQVGDDRNLGTGPILKRHQSSTGDTHHFNDMTNNVCSSAVKLMTICVDIICNGVRKTVRAFLDPGSQRSYILDSTAEAVGLKTFGEEKATHSMFAGISTTTIIHKKYQVLVGRQGGGFCCEMAMRGSKKICNPIPQISRQKDLFRQLKENKIYVSDIEENSRNVPEIEILIGTDNYGRILTGKIVQLDSGITAQETKLGWVLSGESETEQSQHTVSMMLLTMTAADAPIENLWKLETIGIHDDAEAKTASQLESEAKEKLNKTITRKEDGRYCVGLPFKDDHPVLPSNMEIAKKRLERTTKKLLEAGKFQLYDAVLKDWTSEFTEVVPNEDGYSHFIPHRPVFKDSLTTPVRPVFDCSCKSGKALSLNDCLHTGSNYVLMIPELLLRFREKKIAVTADIRKAFQMIEVQRDFRKYLRFIWWQDKCYRNYVVYQHKRLPFGATCSPFILGAVLEYHLTRVPLADRESATKLLDGFYVDNYVGSEDEEGEYYQFRQTATRLLAEAKMDLRMWMSNIDGFEDAKTITTSILGLQWNRKEDSFFVPAATVQKPEKLTKRTLLSTVQKIFDPLGFLSPALLPMKLILQKQWIAKKSWDEQLPYDENVLFSRWFNQLQSLQDIKIPRLATAGITDKKKWSLHTFCDSSSSAYASAVFLRVETDRDVSVQLLMSKARVAPVKSVTIPRLELMGCLIGSRLATMVKKALRIEEIEEHYWSDSSAVLAWIKCDFNHQVFVRNRVKEIREKTNAKDWKHVPGVLNPADLPSRGCFPLELLQSKWWEGPEWLKSPKSEWPSAPGEEDEEVIMSEVKEAVCVNSMSLLDIPRKEYTFAQTVRIMGWVLRFFRNAKRKNVTKFWKLTNEEFQKAELVVLKQIQDEGFSNLADIKSLPLMKDQNGVLRVKTRLLNREDLTDFKTPAILPCKHPLVRKIIREAHYGNYHAGINFLMTHLREKYWIVHCRKTIKQVIGECFRCRRYASKAAVVEVGPLPQDRVKDAEPFEVTGIDLAGPLHLKNEKKAWIVLYTCAVYRAVFLDLVTSLSTAAFIKSLERFIEQHGRPRVIYSDNGTNFVGAHNLFKTLDWNSITSEEGIKPIQWKFNPPSAAWWGGWWERLIRTVKDLLRKTLGKATVNHQELQILLKKVSEIMNGRPLTYVSEDPEDLEPLTPAMFLKTPSTICMPEVDTSVAMNMRNRHQHIKSLKEELKRRFRREYLAHLVSLPKKVTRPLKVGEVVFIGNEQQKRLDWQLGRILEFYPGKDGINRVARVKTASGVLLRPIQRLYPLESDIEVTTGRTRSGRQLKAPERLGY